MEFSREETIRWISWTSGVKRCDCILLTHSHISHCSSPSCIICEECDSVWLGIHSSQAQLAMSCNQGRKLTPATRILVAGSLYSHSHFAMWPTIIWRLICSVSLGRYRVQMACRFWHPLVTVDADWRSQFLHCVSSIQSIYVQQEDIGKTQRFWSCLLQKCASEFMLLIYCSVQGKQHLLHYN